MSLKEQAELEKDDWKDYWTLDQIAECLPVKAELGRKLWGEMVEDNRDRDGWTQLEFNETSPNRASLHVDKFTADEIAEMDLAYTKEFGI